MTLPVKTQAELVTQMTVSIGSQVFGLTNANVGGVVQTHINAYAEVVSELYSYTVNAVSQCFADSATGTWLERRALERGVTRREAVATRGTVTLSRTQTGSARIVPAGTWVGTVVDSQGTQYQYQTVSAYTFGIGVSTLDVVVEAKEAGSSYNVGGARITVLLTFIADIDNVTNAQDWITTTGVDEETDASLRTRYFLAWNELSIGSTAEAYESWALSVSGVASARARANSLIAGQVDVVITDTDGGTVPASLLGAVQTVLDARRPLCITVVAKEASSVSQTIVAEVTPEKSYGTLTGAAYQAAKDALEASVQDAVENYIENLGIGRDVIVSRIYKAIMAVSGVFACLVTTPTSNQSIGQDEVAAVNVTTITMLTPTTEDDQ